MFRFEKLDVWHRAITFAEKIYAVNRAFPGDERFGLTSQLRRAAVSISSNIAEGSSRSSDNDFARFLGIAYGSLMEVVSQIKIAQSQSFLKEDDYLAIYRDADELARMLSGLRSTVVTRTKS